MSFSNFNWNYKHITIGNELNKKDIPVDFKKYDPSLGDFCIALESKDNNPQIAASSIKAYPEHPNEDFMSIGHLSREWETLPLDIQKLVFQTVVNRLQTIDPQNQAGATLCVSITWVSSDGVLHKLTGNLGDSHEHLFNKIALDESVIKPELLVKIHTTHNPEETKRILDEFGVIIFNRIYNSAGSSLEPTRVLGDCEYKPFISDTLEFNYSTWKLTPEQIKIFFMSCDGYDRILNHQKFLAEIVKNASIENIAQKASMISPEIFTGDNLSYILVIYDGKKISAPLPPLMTALADGHGGSSRAKLTSQNILGIFEEVIAEALDENKLAQLKKAEQTRLENLNIHLQKKYHLKLMMNLLIPYLNDAKASTSTNYIGSYELSFKVSNEKEDEVIKSFEKHRVKYYQNNDVFTISYMPAEEIERTKKILKNSSEEKKGYDFSKDLNELSDNYMDNLIDLIADLNKIAHNEQKINPKKFKEDYRLVLHPLDKKESQEIKPLYISSLSQLEKKLPKKLQTIVIDPKTIEKEQGLTSVLYVISHEDKKKFAHRCAISTLEGYKQGECHIYSNHNNNEMIIHEALMMQTLKSEYTQELLGINMDDDRQHFINITEALPTSLKSFLDKAKAFSFEDKCNLALNICQGLQHIHDHHLVYGILTNQSIRFNEKGRMRITDFTLTHPENEITMNIDSQKTNWSSPEFLLNGKTTKESDIFSLGMIIYEVFTGKTPHEEFTLYKIINRKEPTSLLSFENCPPAIRKLIEDCCHKNPKKRPALKKVAMILDAFSKSQTAEEEKLGHSFGLFKNKTPIQNINEKNKTNCLMM